MIILIDNYDSFTYNLVHYFQEIGEKVRVYRNDEKESDFFIKEKPKFLVISPGPSSPRNAGICLELIKKNSELKYPIPTLGVCLGHQAIAEAFNSKIVQSGKPVHGKVSLIHHNSLGLFNNLKNPFKATRYHSLIIEKESISKNLNITAKTEDGVIMGIQHVKLPFYGVQFHPESIATEHGHQIVKNFINCL
ncbi:MAG: anthranilate/aminodeoxychorismate synthase component II [Rickettsiales bacterium]|nr:anthranilate/aminodeoxychorismate synthase component II [Rickettsiales bacterium]OUT44910.1 MAG: anthranilate/aminodeoxychorismate synthase component II [Pelagibacteraceae bacterium TMED13]|tara:strand:+ start:8117 stop:8692 length:576 start_codon:yes stop_codon:yes gene_type:complete